MSRAVRALVSGRRCSLPGASRGAASHAVRQERGHDGGMPVQGVDGVQDGPGAPLAQEAEHLGASGVVQAAERRPGRR